jgi:hypothetical protein
LRVGGRGVEGEMQTGAGFDSQSQNRLSRITHSLEWRESAREPWRAREYMPPTSWAASARAASSARGSTTDAAARGRGTLTSWLTSGPGQAQKKPAPPPACDPSSSEQSALADNARSVWAGTAYAQGRAPPLESIRPPYFRAGTISNHSL